MDKTPRDGNEIDGVGKKGVLTVRVGCQTKDRKTARPRDGKFRRAERNRENRERDESQKERKGREGFLVNGVGLGFRSQ